MHAELSKGEGLDPLRPPPNPLKPEYTLSMSEGLTVEESRVQLALEIRDSGLSEQVRQTLFFNNCFSLVRQKSVMRSLKTVNDKLDAHA